MVIECSPAATGHVFGFLRSSPSRAGAESGYHSQPMSIIACPEKIRLGQSHAHNGSVALPEIDLRPPKVDR